MYYRWDEEVIYHPACVCIRDSIALFGVVYTPSDKLSTTYIFKTLLADHCEVRFVTCFFYPELLSNLSALVLGEISKPEKYSWQGQEISN